MKIPEWLTEIITIILAAAVLAVSFSFKDTSFFLQIGISFLIIIILNVLIKKAVAYYFEAKTTTKLWGVSQFWFTVRSHLKKPLPMIWLPIVLAFFTKGILNFWFGVLEFDIKPKKERVSRRHGLYRFSEMTDWHIALIAVAGIIINLIAAVVGYLAGFETFAKLNIWFAAWSIIPLSSLDGSKIFFGSRPLWFTILVIIGIFLGYSLVVI
tara:strand:+ start:1088 stop:1720 length:633 start_codon:yes stop_codon:yes gene_type:complete